MKKTTIILGISTLALLGLSIAQYRHIQKLNAQACASTVACSAKVAEPCAQQPAPVQPRPEPAVAAVRNAGESGPVKPAAAVAFAPRKTAAKNKSPMADLAEMMKATGMKEMIRTQQKGQMDQSYGPLFKYLQLSGTDLETFKGLLLDKQMALMDAGLVMMNQKATPQEKDAATKQIKTVSAAYDAQLKKFLGDEDYAVYQSYEATQPERAQVNVFKGALSAKDQLTIEQEDRLIRAIHEQRTNFHYSAQGLAAVKQPGAVPKFTPEMIKKHLEENARLQEQCAAQAAAILTPIQLEQFKTSQKQQQALQEMGMRMAAKMFADPEDDEPSENP